MDRDTFYYSILTGQGQKGIDKNTVIFYLNNNPNLKRKGNEFFLKDYSWIESPAFVLGSRALYVANRWWCWPREGESLLKNHVYFNNGSSGGSGAPRIFYEFCFPEVLEGFVNRMVKYANELTLYDKQRMISNKKKEINKDFKNDDK
jgi:hypothetical protein